jgi:cytochrome b
MRTTEPKALVWDLPVRIGHWLLVACFALAWLTGESEERRLVHVFAGSAMVGIVLFRVVWGLVGSRHALFVDFVRGPRAVLAYLRSLFGPEPEHWVGHNPAGGWAIVALLGLILVGGASGWLNYQELGGEWLEEVHEVVVHLLLVVVAVHLGGVLIGGVAHRENLVRPMFTGLKTVDATEGIASARPLAAVVLLAWVVAVSVLLSR